MSANPKPDQSLADKAHRVLPGGTFGNTAAELVIREGRASRVWDENGNEYVDYLLGSGPMLVGHAHPEVNAAAQAQLAKGTTFFANNRQGIDLAAAGIATLNVLRQPGTYERLFATGRTLMDELSQCLASAGLKAQIVGEPAMFDVVFTDGEVRNYRDTLRGVNRNCPGSMRCFSNAAYSRARTSATCRPRSPMLMCNSRSMRGERPFRCCLSWRRAGARHRCPG
jgi:glutamate-1-semialdehyde aminotransferase